jgi:hypothetical protein
MAARPIVRHLLIGASGGQDLTRGAAGDLLEIRAVAREGPGAAGERQPAIAGVHHEVDVLGGDQVAGIAELGHTDRGGHVVFAIGVHGDDEANLASVAEGSRGAVAGKEEEHPVFALDLVDVRKLVADGSITYTMDDNVSGKLYKLDDAGNAKAVEAMSKFSRQLGRMRGSPVR